MIARIGIVGIASSAEGAAGLQDFFQAMPDDSNLAFIVLTHPDQGSAGDLLARIGQSTAMQVSEITSDTTPMANHIYVGGAGRDLVIKDGVLRSMAADAKRPGHHAIDLFFSSLAEDQGEQTIGVLLSLSGTSGSAGLRAIKAEGGITIAQASSATPFREEPRSGTATEMVDLVLPPGAIPEALLAIARHSRQRAQIRLNDNAQGSTVPTALLALLRARTGRDFSVYKKPTLLRRIHRRMGLGRITTLDSYIERLRQDDQERRALVADLSINVSGFFREPKAWEVLTQTVIAPLITARLQRRSLRVWVPGCSTGEEAYSVAMLLQEQAEVANGGIEIRIFATDVSEAVLATARTGRYPKSAALDIGPSRLARFLDPAEDGFVIKKTLREMITFAPQDLVQDPPFSHLDLISCRNLLIYLEPDTQKRVLSTFHFALEDDGYLFLGPAESVSNREPPFVPLSKKWRIYQRGPSGRHHFAARSQGEAEMRPPAENGDASVARTGPGIHAGELMLQALTYRYAPAAALIADDNRIFYLRGPVGDYLQPSSGEPSYDLLAMARDGLQIALRTAVREARDSRGEATCRGRVRRGRSLHPVRIVVTPIPGQPETAERLLVGFYEEDVEPGMSTADEPNRAIRELQLQAELDRIKAELRLTIDQMEATNEELKASNEEIRSANEELQASNDELETSREELQSLNEELNTVNSQLHTKIHDLEERTADLNNLLNSTDIATLFLDRALCIRWFTPAMKALFELLPSDVGRPIAHFAQKFTGGNLLDDAQAVLAKLAPMDAEVLSDDGRWYIRHLVPYRTTDDRIGGVVVSFTDITERKGWEQRLQWAKEFAEGIVHSVPAALLVLTPELQIQAANDTFCRLFQVNRGEVIGWMMFEIDQKAWDIPALQEQLKDVLRANKQLFGYEVDQTFSRIGPRTMMVRARRLANLPLILVALEDITERKRAEASLRANEIRLRKVLETDAVGVSFLDAAGTIIDANDLFLRITCHDRQDVTYHRLSWQTLTPPEWMDAVLKHRAKLQAAGRVGPHEREYLRKDGARTWVLIAGAKIDDGTVVEYCIDISDRKRAEEERELLAQELSHRVKNTLAVVQALASQTNDRVQSVEEFRKIFIGRLRAMARAHSLLLEANWRSADLCRLVQQSVSAYRAGNPEIVRIDGVSVTLTPKQGLGLSLILHELATNAAKYGALSQPQGHLQISWTISGHGAERQVDLHWQERDGPKVVPPSQSGFGTKLVAQACEYELQGEARLAFDPDGLCCDIRFPLSESQALA